MLEAERMERSDRIRRLERAVQLVASALMAGVATLGGVAYYLVRSEIWTPIDEALGAVILYTGMGVMAVGLLIAPWLARDFGARSATSLSMRSCSVTPPRSSCPRRCARALALWV